MSELKAIELSEVSKEYPGNTAVDKISFNVGLGEIHGFLGPNGAGKSTTMRMITGLIPASSGTIKIFGKDIFKNPEVQNHVGFLPEQPPLYLNMKVMDYLNFVLDLHQFKETKFRDQAIEKCGLEDVSHRLIGNLSKGFKQRVGIAATLVHNPKLVILDEPTVGLDPAAIDEIRNLIKVLKSEHTIFLSTHHLHEVELLCSHITVINKGEVLRSGTLEKLKEDFVPRQTIHLEISNWNDSWVKELSFSDIEVRTDNSEIIISTTDKEDIRPTLCRELIAFGADLLSVNKEKAHVEDIFRSLTEGNK
ncbi:MAG: MFS transporter [Halobacteriovorax sp.]|nr:MFS transporter [Halobacteriovorax sp.]|tara:strand:- start:81208 stop:82125 length:918 start_codon:yes stop_codon:yes gene_type:complete